MVFAELKSDDEVKDFEVFKERVKFGLSAEH